MPDARKPWEKRSNEPLEQIHQHRKSTRKDELLDDLADFMADVTEENYDGSTLDSLLAALEEEDPIPEADMRKMRAGFDRFLAEQLAAEPVPAAPAAANATDSSSHRRSRTLFKLLPFVAVFVLVLGGISVAASGMSLSQWFVHITSEVFRFSDDPKPVAVLGRNDMTEGEVRHYDTPQEMLDDFAITGQLLPTWLPEGFEVTECTAKYELKGLNLRIEYTSGDSFIYYKICTVTSANKATIELDYRGTDKVEIANIRHFFSHDLALEKVAWENVDFACILQGNITREDLRQMIVSIYGEESNENS